jgi:sugar (pentulose or hexulose) kinase
VDPSHPDASDAATLCREARNYVALDLGASSGRALLGRFDGERLAIDEIHRFPNGPVTLPRHTGVSLHWDILDLFGQVKTGIAKAVECCGPRLVSAGVDTWGVDYGLLDGHGSLIGNPYHYRDSRTVGIEEIAFQRVPKAEIFAATGIQFMRLNTLFQLVAAQEDDRLLPAGARALDRAGTLLMTPDLLNYWLTGERASERTIASTSQLLDPWTGRWAVDLITRLQLPERIFPGVIEPGAVVGSLLSHVADETGALNLRIVAPGSHDTASAVAAVPVTGDARDHAYLSSGTWSIIGVESVEPVVNTRALECNFTNEGGVCSTIRLMKNITGLWVIQECRRTWAQEGARLDWDSIVRLAEAAAPFSAFIDIDAPEFTVPGNMPARVAAFCRRTAQPIPADKGTIARVVFESLALKYRFTLEALESLVGRRMRVLHIVGGGAQNRLLSQFAANAVGRLVVAGPVEATAVGNLLMQMLATGAIASLAEGRAMVVRSFHTEAFEPDSVAAWDEAYGRFKRLLA